MDVSQCKGINALGNFKWWESDKIARCDTVCKTIYEAYKCYENH